MKLLISKKLKLPQVYFITNKLEIKEIPIGIPFILGDPKDESYLIRILEYEILYREAIRSGFPFNFKKILTDFGFIDLQDFDFEHPVYMEYTTEDLVASMLEDDLKDLKGIKDSSAKLLKDYIRDSSVYVDITKLKELKVFPVWLEKIEDAIKTNIHNFASYNANMYNKKLEGMYGSLDLTSPDKNLIIIDISGSIPKGVSSTCLALAKNLSESFYADILITGSKSTLYPYENIQELNIDTIYTENGMDNDQTWFKNLLTGEEKKYKTAIVFGDNHSPCSNWSNKFNTDTKTISRKDGQKMCKWTIDKLISFHTNSTKEIAGYADWFTPKEIEHISNWVKYLN